MKCSSCGNNLKEGVAFCPNCGTAVNNIQNEFDNKNLSSDVNNNTQVQEGSPVGWGILSFFFPIVGLILFLVFKNDKPKASKVSGICALVSTVLNIIIITISFALLGGVIGSFINEASSSSNYKKDYNSIYNNDDYSTEEKTNEYKLGETFEFDDFEITLGTDYSFTKIDNEYSDKYGKDVVKLPIELKNISDDESRLNMFYYTVIGSDGTELDRVASYFLDDAVDYADELRSGDSYTKYIYFLYDGDGQHTIKFDNYTEKVSVDFNIKNEDNL